MKNQSLTTKINKKKREKKNVMKHSFVPDTRQKYMGHCTYSESNECDGHDNSS